MSPTDRYIELLERAQPLRESLLGEMIDVLSLPVGSRGLDAGCGVGQPALILSEFIGQAGHVTGIDISPEAVARAREIARDAGMQDRVDFEVGDVSDLPFDDATFDWAWSSDCVGHMPVEPEPLIKELARVVKPGGKVAISAYISQMLLPGHPALEARLNATSAGYAPFRTGSRPGRHFMRALRWFAGARLSDSRVQTFVGEIRAPLEEELRDAVSDLFEMRWGPAKMELCHEDWDDFRRLTTPGSSDFILDLPEYYGFFTYTMFWGRIAS
jgi:demethylmenaquinone methyltransferase/2-methoxy-6-polyprenyl-1,4-benzoquinol methylase